MAARWTCALLAVAVTATATAVAVAADQDSCVASEGDEVEYTCAGGAYEVRGAHHHYVDIRCQGDDLECSRFPHLTFARNSTIEAFSIRNCGYQGPVSCLLRKMGVADAKRITLKEFRTPITAEHVRGLAATTAFRIYDDGFQSSVPYGVVSSLPALKEFRLNGAQVALAPGHFQAPSLTFLELSSDSIEELPPGSFKGLPNLEYLGVWGNHVSALHNGTFEGLASLRTLNVESNGIESLAPGALGSMPRLASFAVSDNPLADLQDGVFQDTTQVENITISNCRSASLQLGGAALANLPNLRNVFLEWCNIRELPDAVFHNSTGIVVLSLKNNRLEELHANVFVGQTEMRRLDLSNNWLKGVTEDLFLPLKGLLDLDLSHNRIEFFASHLFSPLNKLEKLSAANNQLTRIADTAFQGAPLRTLELANNLLSFTAEDTYEQYGIDMCPFNGLLDLRVLDLKNNNIDSMCDYWRIMMTRLEKLDLSYNKFSYLDTTDLSYTSSQVTVDLRHNNISGVFLHPALWSEINSSATLLLGQNPFICDCRVYDFIKVARSRPYSRYFPLTGVNCISPPSLKDTSVAKVALDKLVCEEDNCASHCECVSNPSRRVVEARCSGVDYQLSNVTDAVSLRLTTAPRSLQHLPFENVVELDLSGLKLAEIRYDHLPKTVKFLNLSDNQLEFIPSGLLSGEVRVALRNNALACDCWHYKHVAELLSNVTKIADYEQVACEDGTLLSVIDARRLCDVFLASSIGVTLAVLGAICVVFAVLLYRYSFEAKIYFAKYFPCLLPEEKYDATKKYDVFISYAHQDEDFVRDELLARLEGPPNHLRACVHYRDWLVGETIPYNIAKSVEEARRTIIVLSDHFLDSIWGLLEFRAAHVQAAREGRARIIVILLQDVTARKGLDKEIDAYLHTNTYIKWGEPWFWEKLEYALPKRGRAVDRGEERRLQSVAKKLVESGLEVQLNAEGKLVNAAFVKDV